MNEKRQPNLHELSLYYDGLLDGEKQRQIESQLADSGEEQQLLHIFGCFDSALDADLPEERLEALLSGNLKGIHERLVREEHQERKQSATLWDWLLMPRNLLAGLAGLLILFGVLSLYGPLTNTSTMIALSPTLTPSPADETISKVTDVLSNPVDAVVDETQKQVILAAVSKTKSILSSGYGYAKEQSKPLGDALFSAPQTADLGVAFRALASSIVQPAINSPENTTKSLTPSQQLAQAGTSQLAIGLGASLLSLMSVI